MFVCLVKHCGSVSLHNRAKPMTASKVTYSVGDAS